MARGPILLLLCVICSSQIMSTQNLPEGGYVAAQKLLQFITDNLILNNPNASEEMKEEAKNFDSSDRTQMMRILNFLNQNNARLSGESIPLNKVVTQQTRARQHPAQTLQEQQFNMQQQQPQQQRAVQAPAQQLQRQQQVVAQQQPTYDEQPRQQTVQLQPVVSQPQQYQQVQQVPIVQQVEDPMIYQQTQQVQQQPVARTQKRPSTRVTRPRPQQQRVVADQYAAMQLQQQSNGRHVQTAQTGGRLLSCQASQPIYDGDEVLETYCRCSDGSYGFNCQEGFGNPCVGDQQFFPAHPTLGPAYFIHCSWSLPYLKKCPQNLVWDQDLTTCNWPSA